MAGSPEILGPRAIEQIRRAGLQITRGVGQIGMMLEFENPARLADATAIGRCSIGAFTYVGPGSEIRNTRIGRYCAIAANAGIGPAEHPMDWLSCHPFQYAGVPYFSDHPDWESVSTSKVRFRKNSAITRIGHDVWIGRNAIIRQGVTVGTGAIIAGGAFVNRDVAPYTIVAGVPAKPVRRRLPEALVTRLLASEWWNWKLDSKKHGFDFSRPDEFVTKFEKLKQQNAFAPLTPERYGIGRGASGEYELTAL